MIGRRGRRRKRWIYVAAFSEELMLCAARVEVGPFAQTFASVLERRSGELTERTRTRLPGRRDEVWGDRNRIHIDSPPIAGELRLGRGRPIEVRCPTPEGYSVWTRKAAGIAVDVALDVGGRRYRAEARGVTDETSGRHPRHTTWSWSAGVGTADDGRPVAWNLVEGINDPPSGSERAVWVDGEPFEPDPVAFQELAAIAFADGSRLEFSAEAERRRSENRLVVRYSYRQPFGTFAGSLPRGIELGSGLGVMEHHDAHW